MSDRLSSLRTAASGAAMAFDCKRIERDGLGDGQYPEFLDDDVAFVVRYLAKAESWSVSLSNVYQICLRLKLCEQDVSKDDLSVLLRTICYKLAQPQPEQLEYLRDFCLELSRSSFYE